MRLRSLSRWVTSLLIVAGGLFFGLVAALALSQWHAGRAFAAVTATCTSDSSGNVTVTLNNDSTVQLTVGTSSSTNFLQLVGASSPNCEPAASVASITFALGTSTGPVTVILNETGTAPIPCVPFEGTIGGNTLQVNLAANDVANFGTTGADVNLSTGTSCAATDTLSGISAETAVATAAPVMVGANGGADGSPSAVTFTASPSANTYSLAGDVDLVGSAGTYTIASTGAGNAVNAGSGSETFAISGNGVDVTAGSGTDTFTLTGNNDSVMGGTGTDTFTVKGSGTAILAVSGGTYTVNNSGTGTVVTGGPGTESFTITGNTAPFTGSAGGTYTLNLPAGSDVTAGSGTETFTITDPAGGYTLTGSSDPAATTTFTVQGTPTTSAIGDALEGGAGTTSFTLNGNGNTLDGSSGPTTFNVTGNDNSYLGGTGTDQVTITGNSNDFHAGPGSEKFFGVAGSPGTNPGDTADFSGIGASSSAPLVVNLSGASETVQGVLVLNGEATLIPSSGSTYTFRDSSSASTALDFTTIIGSGEGNTQFLAGSSGGLTFTGSGSGNQVSFLGNSGVVVNVSGALQTTSAQIGSTKLSGFQIGSGQALVAPPTGSATSCSGSGGSAIASFCDVITDVFTATGPPSGFSTFYAGAPGQTYTFSDAGNNNTFIGGTGTAVFSSGGNFNTFEAGLGTESFSESTTSQEPDNTIDFSNVPVGSQAGCTSTPCSLSVNVSGTQTSVPDFSAALFNSSQAQVAIYSFGQGGSDFTNFIGAAGGDTAFAGGSGNYTYTGQGIGNTLDFSDVPPATATALTFDVTHTPSPQATLGTVPETFSGITNLVGLATGNTTFVGGSTGGYTFNGKGSGNQATFSTQGPSTTLTVQINQTGTNTPVTSGTVTFSLAGGSTLCSAVPVDGSGHASCYATSLPGGSDQILAVYTPPAGSSLSGSGVLITASGTGTANTPTATTLTDTVPSGSCLCQNQTIDFTAAVSSSGTVAGTVTFSLAGGQTLCSAVPVTSGTAACDVGLPAGAFNVLAVFTPNGSTLAGSAASPLALTIATPSASSVSVVEIAGSQLQATINAPGNTVGSVTFSSDLGREYFQSPLTVPSSGMLVVTIPEFAFVASGDCGPGGAPTGCQVEYLDGEQAVVTFTPSTGAVSQSAGVSGTLTQAFSGDVGSFLGPTTTTLSSNATGTISTGTQVTFKATVSATSGTLPSPVLPGGNITFAVVGGATLCTVPVPSGVTSAQLQCSGSLPAGTDDIIATYNPSNGFVAAESSAVLVLSVAAPAGTTATAGTPATDSSSGVVVNLSNSAYTTSATGTVPNVALSSGQVLVAAPPTAGASCAATPLPTFCDSLVGISNVTGSSGGDNTFVAGPAPETYQDSGSAGGDTVDFTHVSTSSSTPLVVNASGATVSGFSPFTASEGSTTLYTFSSNGPDFTTFIGSASGNTDFLAGSLPGYAFNATGGSNAGNSIDFSAISTGVTVNLTGGTSGTVTWLSGADSDTISGLTTVTGSTSASASSPNVFEGGSATYTFTGEGTSNDFKVGTGSETIIDSGPGNTVDFSGLSTPVTVNVSGTQVGSTINDGASTTGATYTFTSFGTTAATFIGSAGGTTFDAGTAADTFDGQGLANDTLSYANGTLGGPLTVCVVAEGTCTAGEAVLGSVDQFFSGIKVFFGLATGNTTFVAGDATGQYTFNAPASNGKVDFSKAVNGINANLTTGTVTLHSGATDTILGMTSVLGSTAGHNTFVAGTAPETFGDTGTVGGDTIDFTHVSTSSSTPLVVNASGATVNGFSPFTATEGLTPLYTFSNGGPNFTTFIGAATGSTQFLAGSLPGFTFTATNAGNSIDFSSIGSGVTVNLTAGTSGTVTWLSGADSDTINGLTAVTGSSSGFNVFEGGPASYTFTGGGPDNDFKVGTGSETIIDSGAGNTVDFSGLSTPVTLNVSGSLVGSTPSDSASTSGATYTFTTFGTTAATFIGSAAGTTFDAGTAADTFQGRGLANDTLSYANGTLGGPLTVCVVAEGTTCTAGEAVLGSVDQFFSGIKVFFGLATGSTTFVAGDASGGFTFNAPASNGKVDFSSAGAGINANLTTGTVTLHGGATDTISGISTVFGSTAGHNTFVAGAAPETFGDTGTVGSDTIDFTHVSTSSSTPLVVNASGATVNGFSPFTATEGLSPLYTFSSNGANFTTFIGSAIGNTEFLAGSLPGYTFDATGVNAGNSIDFSAITTGVTVNLTAGTSGTVTWLGGSDSISGLTTVTGSASGSNVFEGGPGPSIYVFSSGGTNNDFKVGTGSETINATGAGSTIDFSGLTTQLTVNVSGSLVGSTGSDTASTTGSSYTFTSFGNVAATFIGSSGGTTFDAGTAADTFQGQGLGTDTLTYANGSLGGPLTVCVVAEGNCTAGEALLGSVKEFFSGITVFVGLTSGSTTFVAGDGSGGFTFTAPSSNGKVDFSTASAGISANLNTGTVTLHGGATDTISGINSVIGSTAGHNTFVAGPSSATFGDNGAVGGDAVDFSNVLSTSSGTQLIINVSGASVNVSGALVPSYSATVGSGITYTFSGNGPDFITFTGAGTGNTRFIAPNGAGAYTFTGKGTGNTADFSANLQGITVNLSPSIEAGLTTGQVQVGPSADDAISDIATVIGSPTGSNVFYSGLLGTSFVAQSANNELSFVGLTTTGVTVDLQAGTATLSHGASNTDTFNFGTGVVTVEGSTGNDTFFIGTSAVVLQGGGGQDAINLSHITGAGVIVNLQAGAISGATIGGVTYTPGCSSAAALCVTSVTGTAQADTFVAGAGSLSGPNPVAINGNGGTDTLDLADISQLATVVMPITTLGVPAAGFVTSTTSGAGKAPPSASGAGITFSGVSNLIGTAGGGDHVYAGTGTETLTETGTTATLDFSAVSNGSAGVTINANDVGGLFTGSVSSSVTLNVTDTFTGFETFVGTSGADTFIQSGPSPTGGYFFFGEAGTNTLNLSQAPTGTTAALSAPVPSDGCTGSPNNDGTASDAGVIEDTFTCVATVASTSTFTVQPGQTAFINGGGAGTLELVNGAAGEGATINLATGTVTGDGFNFSFSGMTTIVATAGNDTFIAGPGSYTLIGGGGSDTLNFSSAPAAEDVNLSGSSYTTPAGIAIPAFTATGGYGGTLSLEGISNVISTRTFSDVIVAANSGVGSLEGGSGSDRFVLTGGFDYIAGGTGTYTLDLSDLPGPATLDLAESGAQSLGAGNGDVWILSGDIGTVVAPNSGSTLIGGPGTLTLTGGTGNDTLIAGDGNQTLIGGGGTDVLEGGVGNDTLEGGADPVTFVPGAGNGTPGSGDTLTSQTTGNTLSYAGAPNPVIVSLFNANYTVPTTLKSTPANTLFGGKTAVANTATGGWGATVHLGGAGVTNIVGTGGNDIFVTDPTGFDDIQGGGGSDLFVIKSGSNTLTAGTGSTSDFLFAGVGDSNQIFGGGASTVDFSQAPAGVQVILQPESEGSATGGFGGSQSLTGVLNVVGTEFNDVLVAGAKGATVIGLNGNDFLQAGPTGGDTLTSDGVNSDTFCAMTSCEVGGTVAGGGDTMTGGTGNDEFFALNGVVDTINGEGGFNFAEVDPGDKVTNIQTTTFSASSASVRVQSAIQARSAVSANLVGPAPAKPSGSSPATASPASTTAPVTAFPAPEVRATSAPVTTVAAPAPGTTSGPPNIAAGSPAAAASASATSGPATTASTPATPATNAAVTGPTGTEATNRAAPETSPPVSPTVASTGLPPDSAIPPCPAVAEGASGTLAGAGSTQPGPAGSTPCSLGQAAGSSISASSAQGTVEPAGSGAGLASFTVDPDTKVTRVQQILT